MTGGINEDWMNDIFISVSNRVVGSSNNKTLNARKGHKFVTGATLLQLGSWKHHEQGEVITRGR
jgi:hypothetical protein